MSSTTETPERVRSESGALSSSKAPAIVSRWTRTHTIWTLMILSLVPGIGVALFRNAWVQQVPPTVRIVTYVTCGILIAVACGLIVKAPDAHHGARSVSPHDG